MSNEHNNQAGARRPLDENALAHAINMMPWRTDDIGPKLREFAYQLWLQFCSVQAAAPAPAVPDTHISVQEAWEAAGGNPGIKASKADLIIALQTLDTVCDEADAAPAVPQINYHPGTWYEVKSREELEAFFLSRLPAIREAAREHGYAIGLHGSLRRDMDLIAVPWRDGASDKDKLAHAIAMAAVGITRDGGYQWEIKPAGRVATSLPCAWTTWHGEAGAGHIDLSVTPDATSQPVTLTDDAPDPVLSALMGMPVSRKVWGEFKAWQANKEAALREKSQPQPDAPKSC